MFAFPPLESRQEDSNEGSDSARAIEIARAKELLSGRETGWLGGDTDVEAQLECEDAVTWEDIVDKLLFEVNILKECVDSHTLMNWKKRIQEKCAVGLLLQKTPETKKTRCLSNCSTGLCLNPNKELKDSSTVQSYLVPCVRALMGLTTHLTVTMTSWL